LINIIPFIFNYTNMNLKTNEIVKQIKLQDKMRDPHWVTQQYNKGRLFINDTKVTDEIFNSFKIIIRACEEIYENFWDIDIEVIPRIPDKKIPHKKIVLSINIRGIVIYFPKIVITNRDEKSHLIKDLFVKIILIIENNKLKIYDLKGGRTTLSYAEYCSNYCHSHLGISTIGYINENSSVPIYNSFCIGTGNINIYQADLNTDGITQEKIIAYLIQIMTLVGYESIEGTPYRYIKNIMNKNTGRISNPDNDTAIDLYNKVINYHKQEKKVPCLEFIFENGIYKVKDNEKFDEFLMSQILTDEDKKETLCMVDETGIYYQYGSTPTVEQPPVLKNKYIFQGKEISFKVEDMPNEKNDSNMVYSIHPTIKEILKEKIKYDINRKSIRQSTINRYS